MWPSNRRRNDCPDAAEFIRRAGAARHIGRLLGVSDRTVRRWASGEDHPPLDQICRLVDLLWPLSTGSVPVYSSEMGIDGNTRVGGVGEYSLRAARGDLEYVGDAKCQDPKSY